MGSLGYLRKKISSTNYCNQKIIPTDKWHSQSRLTWQWLSSWNNKIHLSNDMYDLNIKNTDLIWLYNLSKCYQKKLDVLYKQKPHNFLISLVRYMTWSYESPTTRALWFPLAYIYSTNVTKLFWGLTFKNENYEKQLESLILITTLPFKKGLLPQKERIVSQPPNSFMEGGRNCIIFKHVFWYY